MTVKMVPVTTILQKVRSTADWFNLGEGPQAWFFMIRGKMMDPQTPAIIRAIEAKGFLDPICMEDHGNLGWRLGNGHHRLAIAILLGLDEIPVDFSGWYTKQSTFHAQEIRNDRQDEDRELARWIARTAVSDADIENTDYLDCLADR